MRSNLEKIPKKPFRSFHWWERESEEFPFEWHHHPELELTLIAKGEGLRMVGPTIHNYEENDLVLIGSNIPHTYVCSPMHSKQLHKAIVVQFDRKLIDQFQQLFGETVELKKLLDDSAYGLSFANTNEKNEIIEDLLKFPKLDEAFQPSALLSILLKLNRSHYENIMLAKGYKRFIKDKSHQRIERVYEYLHENFNTNIQLSTIAELVHMNESSFCRFFKKTTSKTVSQQVKEMRIAHAARLLIDADLNVTQVAYESGYNDISNFSKHFKEIKKKSPLQFKKQFIGHENN